VAATSSRSLVVAQHEAAHIVVGVALGLRLSSAKLSPVDAPGWLGYALFPRASGLPWAVVLAAGVAWDRALGGRSDGDLALLRRLGFRRPRDVHALEVCAAGLLATRGEAHGRVTRALLERDLTGADILLLAQGERLADEP
jgi:hypothetical protein